MTAKTATYKTILPDEIDPIGFGQFNQPPRRQFCSGGSDQPAQESPGKSGKQENAGGVNDRGVGQPANPNAPVDDLGKHIGSNNRLTYGLLIVIAILIIVIAYQVFQQRKLNSEAAKLQQMPTAEHNQAGNQPPPRDAESGQMRAVKPAVDRPSSQQINQSAAVRNDRILHQAQQKNATMPKSKCQSAMSRRNNGCTNADDKRRLETIMEDSEATSDIDPIREQARAIVAEQMLQDMDNRVGDEPLGTGSVGRYEIGSISDEKSRRPESDLDDHDEALIEPGNQNVSDMDHLQDDDHADDESTSAEQVAVMCSQILAHGSRAGQECGRDCRPGKSKCERHFAMAAKKSNQG